jgi:hypothetical protein
MVVSVGRLFRQRRVAFRSGRCELSCGSTAPPRDCALKASESPATGEHAQAVSERAYHFIIRRTHSCSTPSMESSDHWSIGAVLHSIVHPSAASQEPRAPSGVSPNKEIHLQSGGRYGEIMTRFFRIQSHDYCHALRQSGFSSCQVASDTPSGAAGGFRLGCVLSGPLSVRASAI